MTPYAGPADFTPAYLRLGAGELASRAERALEGLASCRICPRDCEVNRLKDRWSACKTGRHAVVTSAFPHMGEEDCLRGWNGSGTIFFGHCNLRCVFCQNYDISQGIRPPSEGTRPKVLAGLMLSLQRHGCHNINFVTPEHVVPQVLEALVIAVDQGLRLPIVYNTSAYDSLESLALLDGVVDIYMPDLKLFSPTLSKRYLKAQDYPEVAKAALKDMHRQVGFLDIDPSGLARRGVLIRHLVMPGLPEESVSILEWIVRELGPDTYVNVMGQYRPGGKVGRKAWPELDRPLEREEYRAALRAAEEAGLRRLDSRDLP
ncbi:MAG: radical SAM protein [Gemmatimonadetes bacterium]|nr:radical SAM protein [Gemmatimonadota bacterium]NNM07124.1 radical SAM protein [Gemmatimonadota bacterium]